MTALSNEPAENLTPFAVNREIKIVMEKLDEYESRTMHDISKYDSAQNRRDKLERYRDRLIQYQRGNNNPYDLHDIMFDSESDMVSFILNMLDDLEIEYNAERKVNQNKSKQLKIDIHIPIINTAIECKLGINMGPLQKAIGQYMSYQYYGFDSAIIVSGYDDRMVEICEYHDIPLMVVDRYETEIKPLTYTPFSLNIIGLTD